MTPERLMALACAAGMVLCVLLARALSPPVRPPVPQVEDGVDALLPRVARVVGELEARREIQAAQDEVLRARTRRERGEAMRTLGTLRRAAPRGNRRTR